ncbi:MAG TPA: hypothetical protein VGM75_33925 [Pseudonocardiaceae bacterium]|jgi:hypothetical protein
MITTSLTLRGYRAEDADLLRGHWQPGELLAGWQHVRPALAEPVTMRLDDGPLYLAGDLAVVRFLDVDWVHRRARLEIGARPGTEDDLGEVLRAAVAHGFGPLNLHRLYGWVTPAVGTPTGPIADAGFEREAVLGKSTWLAGEGVDREMWGVIRND